MHFSERKITKMMDELVFYFLRMKSRDIQTHLNVVDGAYVLTMDCAYEREHRDEARTLERVLSQSNRDKGVEETYWELMGMNGSLQDTELQLVGMMVDEARVDIGENTVHLEIRKNL